MVLIYGSHVLGKEPLSFSLSFFASLNGFQLWKELFFVSLCANYLLWEYSLLRRASSFRIANKITKAVFPCVWKRMKHRAIPIHIKMITNEFTVDPFFTHLLYNHITSYSKSEAISGSQYCRPSHIPDIQRKKSWMMHNISLYERKVVIVPQTNYNI